MLHGISIWAELANVAVYLVGLIIASANETTHMRNYTFTTFTNKITLYTHNFDKYIRILFSKYKFPSFKRI